MIEALRAAFEEPRDHLHIKQIRMLALASVAILGLLGTGLAYIINYRLITDDGPVAASVVIYLLPVVAIIFGAVALHEQISLHAIPRRPGRAHRRRSSTPQNRKHSCR